MLALCLVVSVPAQTLAADPARKAPVRKKASAAPEDFQSAFASAIQFYENFEYERALDALSRAKALAHGTGQEVPVALYQGVVQAELGQREQSLASFRTGLYLQPDAKLPVKVSPKVERDFEEVRQSVLRDLGAPEPAAPAAAAPAPAQDRPVQAPASGPAPGLTAHVEPPPPAPAYVPSVKQEQASGRSVVLPLSLLGAGVVAGGTAALLGMQSTSDVRLAREAAYYDTRASSLKSARGEALAANILFGTAGAAALGALVTFLVPGSSHAPASASTTGGSP